MTEITHHTRVTVIATEMRAAANAGDIPRLIATREALRLAANVVNR